MSSLREQGYRFMVSRDRKHAEWLHPLEVSESGVDWVDCTDMNDAEFDAFMAAGQIDA